MNAIPPPHSGRDAGLELFLGLSRVQALLAERLDERLGTLHGIGCGDFQLLRHLDGAPQGRLRRAELAERVSLSQSAVTRALQPLEKIGLVARQPDPRDARQGYAVLTPAGKALLPSAVETARLACRRALAAAPAEQLAALGAALMQIAGPGAQPA